MKLCECGCGQPVKRRFRKGHSSRVAHPAQRTLEECYDIDRKTDCWVWNGWTQRYGLIQRGAHAQVAHIWVWEQLRGPVPEGLQLDHLCRNMRCVNPDHLEPVTPLENVRRSRVVRLSPEIVRKLHKDYARAGLPKRTFARREGSRLGVGLNTIRDVLDGRTWRDLHPRLGL